MALRRVRITALRCLRHVELSLGPSSNFIFGANGAGKTSILEGIFLLGRGRSFRTRQNSRLVQHGQPGLTVYGEVVEAEEFHRLGVAFAAGHLTKKIDGEQAAGMASLAAILPVYALDPGSHWLVEGGPTERRRFLDWGVFHVEHAYLDAWKTYRRTLSQRNAALKVHTPPAALRPWTRALLEAAAAVDASRRAYTARLTPHVTEFGRRLLNQELSIHYRAGWPKGQDLATALESAERRDGSIATTQAGPHRADLELRYGGRPLRNDVSRGQQKLAAAALVLAQLAVAGAHEPGRQVLLVDDPAAELDVRSLAKLLELLADIPAQRVVTALSEEQLSGRRDGPVFHVEQGELRGV